MSRKDKLLQKLTSRPKNFKWRELKTLMEGLGYKETKPGKTGGSRRSFDKGEVSMDLHQRDPLLDYQIKIVVNFLIQEGHL